ncbi:MAG: hypothetical protein Fur0028_13480 [Bacteroidales bacterium]
MRIILILCLTFYNYLVVAQNETMFHKGQVQITVFYSLMPVKITNSQVGFRYVDGNQNATYLVDTVLANYNLKKRYFGNAFNIGIGYFITENLRTSISLKPHLNSFLSNKSKNGKVYGIQFDLGLDYFYNVSKDLYFSFGTTASRILGGYGITSGGAKNKEYLLVNGIELYDNDIGFHTIDNCWAFSPKIGLHYAMNKNIVFTANSGFQMTFGRTSRMNFAGLQKDGKVKWNRKEYNDADVELTINNSKINSDNIYKLPYKFSGLFFELGTIINLKK